MLRTSRPPPFQAYCHLCGQLGAHGHVDECLGALRRARDAMLAASPRDKLRRAAIPDRRPVWGQRAYLARSIQPRPPISGVWQRWNNR